MKLLQLASIIVGLLLFTGCNPIKSTAEGEKAVTGFHTLFDAENYDRIYDSAHPDFKASGPKAEAVDFIRSVRTKLGKIKASSRTSWRANSLNLKTNVVLTYATEYEHGKGVETFTYRIADGHASLVGWHINSRELVVAAP